MPTSEPVSTVEPGTVLAGDYRIVRLISEGGMGAVYLAEQLSTGKQRALKLMLRALAADPVFRKRFEQEARVAAHIDSEHVVEVLGAGIDSATQLPWLAMELLHGEDLARSVERRGAFPPAEVLAVFEQLCHAVGAAHDQGIIHRDLKPENIFLAGSRRADARFTVKVLDFGIAKVMAEAATQRTAAMGSPMWMAPEQTEPNPIAPSADVWALGLLAFWLLTGRYFWKVANTDEATIPRLMREMLFEPIPSASVRAREFGVAFPVGPGFDDWFSRCVIRSASARFANARDLRAALSVALSSQGLPTSTIVFHTANDGVVGAPPGEVSATQPLVASLPKTLAPTQATAPAAPPRRAQRARILGLTLAGLALVGFALAFVRNPRGSRSAASAQESSKPSSSVTVIESSLPPETFLAPTPTENPSSPAPPIHSAPASHYEAHLPPPAKSAVSVATAFNLRLAPPRVSGELSTEVAHRVLRERYSQYRACFAEGLQHNAALQGRVVLRLSIGAQGNVKSARDGGGDLQDLDVVNCLLHEATQLSFPSSEGPTSAVCPLLFSLEPTR